MALQTFPMSPLPAGMTREFDWGETGLDYDSGAYQELTPWQRPLYRWDIPFKNINEIKQQSLSAFYNARKRGDPAFLMKDPYDYRVNSVLAVQSGVNAGTFSIYDTNSFFTIPDTTTVGSMFSALSGFVRLGVNYWYEQDTGVFSIMVKANTDVWGVRSMQYFRKCVFDGKYREQSVLWNIFQIPISIKEIV